MYEGEKQLDAYDIHPTHPRLVLILNHKGTVTPWCFASPKWAGPDAFPTHPTTATFVARSKKSGNGRVKDRDLALDHWAVFKINIIRCDLRIIVDLVEEKTAS
jgi:hypothetical protein